MGTLQAAISRARRLLDKPIALLPQGVPGVGKEVFARAMHATAAQAPGPGAGKGTVAQQHPARAEPAARARAGAGHVAAPLPGYLCQLHNALQTACAMLDDADVQIDWAHLPDDLADDLRCTAAPQPDVDEAADLRTRAAHTIEQTVQSCAGNLSDAARRLGINRNTLYRKLREMVLR